MSADLKTLIEQQNLQLRLLSLANSYLAPRGWLQPEPRSAGGDPVPWITYPAADFLADILDKRWKVLEFGSGFSTLYLSSRCTALLSVEHNPGWAAQLRRMRPTLSLEVREPGAPVLPAAQAPYERFRECRFELPLSPNPAHNLEHGLLTEEFLGYASLAYAAPRGTYDLIIVDGMARVLCGYFAAEQVREDGWIMLDNSDRWQYNALQKYLISEGFGRIDLHGPGPGNSYGWCTSFFSRALKVRNQRPERPRGAGDLGW